MPKKAGAIFVILGAVLILSALLLFLYNKQEDRNAGQEAELALAEVQSSIQNAKKETAPKPTDATEETEASEETQESTEPSEPTEPLSPEMPRVVINGNEYIGYLSIPDLELELPVMADWTYAKLQVAPCRPSVSSPAWAAKLYSVTASVWPSVFRRVIISFRLEKSTAFMDSLVMVMWPLILLPG